MPLPFMRHDLSYKCSFFISPLLLRRFGRLNRTHHKFNPGEFLKNANVLQVVLIKVQNKSHKTTAVEKRLIGKLTS